MDNNVTLSCERCNLHTMKLYKVDNKRVCRLCKKDFKDNGKFTRQRVKHNYEGAKEYLKKIWKKVKDGN